MLSGCGNSCMDQLENCTKLLWSKRGKNITAIVLVVLSLPLALILVAKGNGLTVRVFRHVAAYTSLFFILIIFLQRIPHLLPKGC